MHRTRKDTKTGQTLGFKLFFEVIKGHGLWRARIGNKRGFEPNAFVAIKLAKKSYHEPGNKSHAVVMKSQIRTKTKYKQSNPTWNQVFEIELPCFEPGFVLGVELSVVDAEETGATHTIGKVSLDISPSFSSESKDPEERWLVLFASTQHNNEAGRVYVRWRFVPPPGLKEQTESDTLQKSDEKNSRGVKELASPLRRKRTRNFPVGNSNASPEIPRQQSQLTKMNETCAEDHLNRSSEFLETNQKSKVNCTFEHSPKVDTPTNVASKLQTSPKENPSNQGLRGSPLKNQLPSNDTPELKDQDSRRNDLLEVAFDVLDARQTTRVPASQAFEFGLFMEVNCTLQLMDPYLKKTRHGPALTKAAFVLLFAKLLDHLPFKAFSTMVQGFIEYSVLPVQHKAALAEIYTALTSYSSLLGAGPSGISSDLLFELCHQLSSDYTTHQACEFSVALNRFSDKEMKMKVFFKEIAFLSKKYSPEQLSKIYRSFLSRITLIPEPSKKESQFMFAFEDGCASMYYRGLQEASITPKSALQNLIVHSKKKKLQQQFISSENGATSKISTVKPVISTDSCTPAEREANYVGECKKRLQDNRLGCLALLDQAYDVMKARGTGAVSLSQVEEFGVYMMQDWDSSELAAELKLGSGSSVSLDLFMHLGANRLVSTQGSSLFYQLCSGFLESTQLATARRAVMLDILDAILCNNQAIIQHEVTYFGRCLDLGFSPDDSKWVLERIHRKNDKNWQASQFLGCFAKYANQLDDIDFYFAVERFLDFADTLTGTPQQLSAQQVEKEVERAVTRKIALEAVREQTNLMLKVSLASPSSRGYQSPGRLSREPPTSPQEDMLMMMPVAESKPDADGILTFEGPKIAKGIKKASDWTPPPTSLPFQVEDSFLVGMRCIIEESDEDQVQEVSNSKQPSLHEIQKDVLPSEYDSAQPNIGCVTPKVEVADNKEIPLDTKNEPCPVIISSPDINTTTAHQELAMSRVEDHTPATANNDDKHAAPEPVSTNIELPTNNFPLNGTVERQKIEMTLKEAIKTLQDLLNNIETYLRGGNTEAEKSDFFCNKRDQSSLFDQLNKIEELTSNVKLLFINEESHQSSTQTVIPKNMLKRNDSFKDSLAYSQGDSTSILCGEYHATSAENDCLENDARSLAAASVIKELSFKNQKLEEMVANLMEESQEGAKQSEALLELAHQKDQQIQKLLDFKQTAAEHMKSQQQQIELLKKNNLKKETQIW